MTFEQRLRNDILAELRENASEEFKALNPELFGGYPEAKQSTKPLKNMSKNIPAAGYSEADFQRQVITELQANGWRVHAERPARTSKGWVTPVQGNAGWPDIIAVRNGRCIVWELKSSKGKATPEQVEWLLELSKCGIETGVLTPDNWEKILEMIR